MFQAEEQEEPKVLKETRARLAGGHRRVQLARVKGRGNRGWGQGQIRVSEGQSRWTLLSPEDVTLRRSGGDGEKCSDAGLMPAASWGMHGSLEEP